MRHKLTVKGCYCYISVTALYHYVTHSHYTTHKSAQYSHASQTHTDKHKLGRSHFPLNICKHSFKTYFQADNETSVHTRTCKSRYGICRRIHMQKHTERQNSQGIISCQYKTQSRLWTLQLINNYSAVFNYKFVWANKNKGSKKDKRQEFNPMNHEVKSLGLSDLLLLPQ